jgi:hypothetical protein
MNGNLQPKQWRHRLEFLHKSKCHHEVQTYSQGKKKKKKKKTIAKNHKSKQKHNRNQTINKQ